MNEYNNTLTLTQKEIENNPFYDKDHHAAFYRMMIRNWLPILSNKISLD